MKQLDPRYVWQHSLMTFFTLLFFPLFAIILLLSDGTPQKITAWIVTCVIIPLILLFVSWVLAKLTYRFYKYELKKEGFRKEAGIIWKEYHTIPYSRIQNVDIYRGILDRLLGLSRILIQTAGSSNLYFQEGRLPGLSVKAAEELRDELIKRANKMRASEGI